jgi:hypothetical protein
VKLIAILICVLVELGLLCGYGGYLAGRRRASRSAAAAQAARAVAYQASRRREIAAGELQRLQVLKVDFVRYTDPRLAEDPWAQIEFMVTNQSGKSIDEVDGGIRLFGRGHRPLGIVGANIVEPLDTRGIATGKTRWDKLVFYPAIRAAIADGTITADYRANRVSYADGSMQRFGASWPDSDLQEVPADVKLVLPGKESSNGGS